MEIRRAYKQSVKNSVMQTESGTCLLSYSHSSKLQQIMNTKTLRFISVLNSL